MRLIKVRIQGFQSFSDSGEMEFSEGVNLIIGQNNAGKSAILRALLPQLSDDPHRTPEKWETFRLRQPEIALTIDASGAEIRDWALRSGSSQYFPVALLQDVTVFMREFFERPSIPISVIRKPNAAFSAPYPSHQLFRTYQERSGSPLWRSLTMAN
jgi:predicted ATP-dependent endonuclease of OLD family